MRRAPLVSAACLAAAVWLFSPPAEAVVVERVVAVVGDKPILLTELRRRAKARLIQIEAVIPPGPQRAAEEQNTLKTALEAMIEEELEAQAAEKAKITVTSDEITQTLKTVAQAQGLSIDDLYKQARKIFGLTEQEYREEIKRQVLEGKMLQARVRNRIRITEEDVKAGYERVVREEKKAREFRPAWIVVSVDPNASVEARAERKALAEAVVKKAKDGEDFAVLAKKFSDDAGTRDKGGDLGIRANHGSPSAQRGRPVVAVELEQALSLLEPGDVSSPVKVGDTWIVLKLLSRQPSQIGTYEQAKNEIVRMLQEELFRKAKKKWIEELTRKTHVERRL